MFAVHWVIISHPIPGKAAPCPWFSGSPNLRGALAGGPAGCAPWVQGRARAGGWLALRLLGPAWVLEELVPPAGGHAPHLLQGLDPLFQEPVLGPKPLCGERCGGVSERHSRSHSDRSPAP